MTTLDAGELLETAMVDFYLPGIQRIVGALFEEHLRSACHPRALFAGKYAPRSLPGRIGSVQAKPQLPAHIVRSERQGFIGDIFPPVRQPGHHGREGL